MKKFIPTTPSPEANSITNFAFKVKGALIETAKARIDHEVTTGRGTHLDQIKHDLRSAFKDAGLSVSFGMESTYNSHLLRFLNDYAYDLNGVIVNIHSKHSDKEFEVIVGYINSILSSKTYYRIGYASPSHGFDHHFTYFSRIEEKNNAIQPFFLRSDKEDITEVKSRAVSQVDKRRIKEDNLSVDSTYWPIYRVYVTNKK